MGGRLANTASIISVIGECNAFITATNVCYYLQNKRVSHIFVKTCQNIVLSENIDFGKNINFGKIHVFS